MSNDDLFPWVRQSLYRLLRTETSEMGAKAESWILATAWLGADAETRDVMVNEIKKDLEELSRVSR